MAPNCMTGANLFIKSKRIGIGVIYLLESPLIWKLLSELYRFLTLSKRWAILSLQLGGV